MRVSLRTVGVCRCGLRQRNSRTSFRTAIIHVHAAAGCMGFTRSSGAFSLGPGRRFLPIAVMQNVTSILSWCLVVQGIADRCDIAVILLPRQVSPAE